MATLSDSMLRCFTKELSRSTLYCTSTYSIYLSTTNGFTKPQVTSRPFPVANSNWRAHCNPKCFQSWV